MKTLLIGDILVPPARQRSASDPAKFSELKRSIREEGLFHAIILTEENALVAGATRLRAISEIYVESGEPIFYDGKEVPFGQVPFTFTHKIDPFSIYKIELEENLRREALSPVDEAVALAGLHKLLQDRAPEILPGTGIKVPVTVKDTAVELGKIRGEARTTDASRVADGILVDKFKDLPEVKNAKSFSEAARLAKKAAGRLAAEALGRIQSNAVPLTDKHRVIVGKAEQHLVGIPQNSVDCIIADPPYGVGANRFGDQSRVGHSYADEEANFWEVVTAIEDNASRICKPEAALFLFVDILMWPRLVEGGDYTLALGEGWYVWPTPLIWYKTNKGHAPQPILGPSRRYEALLYAVRGGRKVRKTGSDVLPFPVPDDREHGAGKPVELYKELLSWIVFPGDLVVDPCAGSGTIISAAHSLDCRSIAIELDAANATLCNARIEEILSVK